MTESRSSLSIHPRFWAGGDKQKHNTCGTSSLAKRMRRAIAGMEKHLEQFPQDAACQSRLATARQRLATAPRASERVSEAA